MMFVNRSEVGNTTIYIPPTCFFLYIVYEEMILLNLLGGDLFKLECCCVADLALRVSKARKLKKRANE